MRPIAAVTLTTLVLSLSTTPAVATKPTPTLTGNVSLSKEAPRAGEIVVVSLAFTPAISLSRVKLRIWSLGRESGKACLDLVPGHAHAEILSASPNRSYSLRATMQVKGTDEVCDLFIEPAVQYGEESSNLGVTFKHTLFESPAAPRNNR